MMRHGIVFVIYAGGGMGKTTACHAIMGWYAVKGVAFSPGELDGSYTNIILQHIGLNSNKPLKGWLQKFMDDLTKSPQRMLSFPSTGNKKNNCLRWEASALKQAVLENPK